MTPSSFPKAKSYHDRHGRMRWRFRSRGFSRELGTAFGSDDFKRRYAQAEAELAGNAREGVGASRTIPGSLSDLIVSFYKSPVWCGLSDSTKHTHLGPIEKLRAQHGDKRVAHIKRKHVMAILARKSNTPAAANNLRKRLAQLLDHAIELEWIESNPVRVTKAYSLSGLGFHTWDEGEIARFFDVHAPGSMAHRAVVLMLYTGAARVDAVKLGPWNIKGDRIEYRRQKTVRRGGVLISMPLHPDLAEVLRGLPADRPFLATVHGKARTPAGLGKIMRKWCNDASLPTCSSHGLRKACARRLAEAGATAHEIMAVTGHRTLSEVQRYTEEATREGLADEAIAKLISRPNREQTVVNHPARFATFSTQPNDKKG